MLDEAKATSSLVVSTISRRCQEPEFLPLFMEALVDILISHFKLYKGALSQVTPGKCWLLFSLVYCRNCFVEKNVEKCIEEFDSEGWSVICAGGEPELGIYELMDGWTYEWMYSQVDRGPLDNK